MMRISINIKARTLLMAIFLAFALVLFRSTHSLGDEIMIPIYNSSRTSRVEKIELSGKSIEILDKLEGEFRMMRPPYLPDTRPSPRTQSRGPLLPKFLAQSNQGIAPENVEYVKLNPKNFALLINNAVDEFQFVEVIDGKENNNIKKLRRNEVYLFKNIDNDINFEIEFIIKFKVFDREVEQKIRSGEIKMLSLKSSSFEIKNVSIAAIP